MNTLIKRTRTPFPSLTNGFFNDELFNDTKAWPETKALANI